MLRHKQSHTFTEDYFEREMRRKHILRQNPDFTLMFFSEMPEAMEVGFFSPECRIRGEILAVM